MARIVMPREITRLIIWAASLTIIWAFLVGLLLLAPGWWFLGQFLIFVIMYASYRVQQPRPAREPERLGPKAEWID